MEFTDEKFKSRKQKRRFNNGKPDQPRTNGERFESKARRRERLQLDAFKARRRTG